MQVKERIDQRGNVSEKLCCILLHQQSGKKTAFSRKGQYQVKNTLGKLPLWRETLVLGELPLIALQSRFYFIGSYLWNCRLQHGDLS